MTTLPALTGPQPIPRCCACGSKQSCYGLSEKGRPQLWWCQSCVPPGFLPPKPPRLPAVR